MTTDKIIAAAREAEAYATSQTNDIVDWKAIAQERFYAIAYRAGMERAAEICDGIADEYERREGRKYPEMKSDAQTGASDCEYAIRAEAHAKNQPESTHDNGNV